MFPIFLLPIPDIPPKGDAIKHKVRRLSRKSYAKRYRDYLDGLILREIHYSIMLERVFCVVCDFGQQETDHHHHDIRCSEHRQSLRGVVTQVLVEFAHNAGRSAAKT